MSRRQPVRAIRGSVFTLFAVLFALSFAATALALPGVGGLAKKAKDKAAKAAGVKKDEGEPAIDNSTVVFDEQTLELTLERIDTMISTYKAAGAAVGGRQAIVDQYEKANSERGDYWQKEGETIMETQRKRDEVNTCRGDAIRAMVDAKMKDYSQKALTDPAIRDKYMKIAMQYNAAAAKGDSAAIANAQSAMMDVMMPSHADSVEAMKKCPPFPAELASERKVAAMDKRLAELSDQVRKFDEKISQAQAQHGNMTREQFATAAERIQMYRQWRTSKSYKASATRGFTQDEIDALEKRLKEIQEAGL